MILKSGAGFSADKSRFLSHFLYHTEGKSTKRLNYAQSAKENTSGTYSGGKQAGIQRKDAIS